MEEKICTRNEHHLVNPGLNNPRDYATLPFCLPKTFQGLVSLGLKWRDYIIRKII